MDKRAPVHRLKAFQGLGNVHCISTKIRTYPDSAHHIFQKMLSYRPNPEGLTTIGELPSIKAQIHGFDVIGTVAAKGD
ncbi:hypothetical protein SDC9_135865 [bioreactor metagenome]|uniref:Uncharacterized protein n=1 Tax=bioreactor metagenome TaxID=1076179 RepID=A0A645DHP8_9ZZZZ